MAADSTPSGVAFDAVAAGYDAREAANPLMQRMRARSLAALRAAFPRGARVLDLGAGTGIEALALAAEGRRVVACDPSGAMLATLAVKAAARGLDVPAHAIPARDAESLVATYGEAGFDGAYSSMGALNMEPDLGVVARALARLVKPGGRVVASVMNRWALGEVLLYCLALKPGTALRRLRSPRMVRVEAQGPVIPVWYPTLGAFTRTFEAAGFARERVEALPFLVPPPYAWERAKRYPRALRALERVDEAVAEWGPVTRLGDHFLVTLRRS